MKAKEKGEDGPLIVRQYGESRGDFINKLFGKNEYDPAFLKQLKEAKLDIVSPQEKGEDGPASVKQFGDPVTNKSKKEKSKVPGSPPETPKLKLFLIILPDETTTL